ncbi:hypothetical protein GBF38_001882 [Nibea albiflora]|uniref:Uncharacterized protein n=1 Tax=Nibea albiflora TaxID=240163 RepID=A0ACB7EDN7_NIBAL|nr:hypothetical protein GBF38_001882 [Nibea albiflora]
MDEVGRLGEEKAQLRELWEMEASSISFIVRATYDVLPSPKKPLAVVDPTYALCPTPATLITSSPDVKPTSYRLLNLEAQPGPRVWQQLLGARGIPPTPCP